MRATTFSNTGEKKETRKKVVIVKCDLALQSRIVDDRIGRSISLFDRYRTTASTPCLILWVRFVRCLRERRRALLNVHTGMYVKGAPVLREKDNTADVSSSVFGISQLRLVV